MIRLFWLLAVVAVWFYVRTTMIWFYIRTRNWYELRFEAWFFYQKWYRRSREAIGFPVVDPPRRQLSPEEEARLQPLIDALKVGNYNAAPGKLTEGCVMKVEDLSPVLQSITFGREWTRKERILYVLFNWFDHGYYPRFTKEDLFGKPKPKSAENEATDRLLTAIEISLSQSFEGPPVIRGLKEQLDMADEERAKDKDDMIIRSRWADDGGGYG